MNSDADRELGGKAMGFWSCALIACTRYLRQLSTHSREGALVIVDEVEPGFSGALDLSNLPRKPSSNPLHHGHGPNRLPSTGGTVAARC